MSLVSIESWISQPEFNKTYMADTSFLVKSTMLLNTDNDQYAKDDHKLLKEFKQKVLVTGCKIIYNSTAKAELLHILRQVLIKSAINSGDIDGKRLRPDFLSLCSDIDADFNKTVKKILKEGYIDFFNELFGYNGEHLSAEFDYCTANCSYVSFNGSLDWSDAIQTMAQYALDSGDAMIVNAAVNTTDCAGILTGDQDYKYCYDIDNFDIIFPNRLRAVRPSVFTSFIN